MPEIIVNFVSGEVLAIVQDILLEFDISVEKLKDFCESEFFQNTLLDWGENLHHADFNDLLDAWLSAH